MTTYGVDLRSGALSPLQTVPSTPSDFTGYSTGAEIWVDRAGRNVYLSNRGHDSIGVFAIDPVKGTLTPRQWVPTRGSVPRFFCFDPAQRFLYVADGSNERIAILDRASLEEIGEIGRPGRKAGEFYHLHSLGVDPSGNLVTGESQGSRVQRFVYKGLSTTATR